MTDLYCAMIHGGLNLNFKQNSNLHKVHISNCCLNYSYVPVADNDVWTNPHLEKLRHINKQNVWAPGCENCQRLESANNVSFRTGMNQGLQILGQTQLSGPARIDLQFDISCNLACRSCGPYSNTYWQKHLLQHGLWNQPISTTRLKKRVIDVLSGLDLSNLRQLVFCGGETLLGQEYWDVANWLGDNVPHAKQQLTLCFQTNGTQHIHHRNFHIIEKFHLIKLHISLDGVGDRFEYLRWPAVWSQVTDNILNLRSNLPGNVMFVVEETVSIFNLLHADELATWIGTNFTTNREGDVVNHTRHLAQGRFCLDYLSNEYVKLIQQTSSKSLLSTSWKENSVGIHAMLTEIKKFDQLRNQCFQQTFPQVADLYARFL